jgi:uncharacterized protein DUF5990
VKLTVIGIDLPGRSFCQPDGSVLPNVCVGVQEGRDPVGLVAGDADSARWDVDVRVVTVDDGFDFRGSAVHGVRGERFVYLTWGDVASDGTFTMFRRAKLMLNRVDAGLVARAVAGEGTLVCTVNLTDGRGGPRCARVDPPAISWTLGG